MPQMLKKDIFFFFPGETEVNFVISSVHNLSKKTFLIPTYSMILKSTITAVFNFRLRKYYSERNTVPHSNWSSLHSPEQPWISALVDIRGTYYFFSQILMKSLSPNFMRTLYLYIYALVYF